MTDRATVDRWLDAYVAAWKSYDPDEIGALFADEVEYRYYPHTEPVRGREAVIEAWLGAGEHPGATDRDPSGIYDGSYRAYAVDGEVAVAVGTSTYTEGPGGPVAEVYDNCFLLRFDADGRCTHFTEYYVKRPLDGDP